MSRTVLARKPVTAAELRMSLPEDPAALPVLTDAQFDTFRTLARRHAGIVIADFKRSMVYRRIKKRMDALRMSDAEAYCNFLASPEGAHELQPLINALTTNKTEFYREKHHFDHLTQAALPKFIAAKQGERPRRLRIWSAGCSTGEEPYSIAMSLGQVLEANPDVDARILATDIDTEVLKRAREGIYRSADIGRISQDLRCRYIHESTVNDGQCRVAAQMRRLVTFKQLNLHHDWPVRGPFDVIFCRNVVIYFDKPAQIKLFDRFADVLAKDGFLYCGHSESLYGISQRFHAIGQSIYQRIA